MFKYRAVKISFSPIFKYILLVFGLFMTITCREAVWISGTQEANHKGFYDVKGTPNENYVPAARSSRMEYDAITWIDSSSNLYLFGGYTEGFGNYTDLLFFLL